MEREQEQPRRGHPLDVKPLSSDDRFQQSKHEVFPLPLKAAYVASSGGGKSSAAIAAIMHLWPHLDARGDFCEDGDGRPSLRRAEKKDQSQAPEQGYRP